MPAPRACETAIETQSKKVAIELGFALTTNETMPFHSPTLIRTATAGLVAGLLGLPAARAQAAPEAPAEEQPQPASRAAFERVMSFFHEHLRAPEPD